MTVTRSTDGDIRRPTPAPIWPPTIDPMASRITASQATGANTMNSTAATALMVTAIAFFRPLSRCRSSAMRMASRAMRMTPWPAPK